MLTLNIEPIIHTHEGREHYQCPCCLNRVKKPKAEGKRGRPNGSGKGYIFRKLDKYGETLEEAHFKTIQQIVDEREEFSQWGQVYRILKKQYKQERAGSKRFANLEIAEAD